MFLGLAWYWWLILLVAFIVSLPLKIKLMKRFAENNKKRNDTDSYND